MLRIVSRDTIAASMPTTMTRVPKVSVALILAGLFLVATAGSAFASRNYVVANNNTSPTNTVSVYELSGTTLESSLVSVVNLATGGAGTGAGFPANVALAVLDRNYPVGYCVFAGDAGSGDISAMKPINTSPYLQLVGNYRTPEGDEASAGGLGLVIFNTSELLGNYTGNGSNVLPALGFWDVNVGCKLDTIAHLPAAGLNGGPIDSMAVAPNQRYLIVAYTDGSVGSYGIFNIGLIGQEMIAGSGVGSGAYAGSVAVSHDGKWAIFGDSSASNTTQLDVASIGSNGVLGPTTTYGGDGSLGSGLNSTSIALSPDNQFIYVVDSGSGQVTTLSFDTATGIVTYPNNCLTDLKGYNASWATASQVDVMGDAGTGQGLYVSEGFLTGDSYIALLEVNSTTGCTTELPRSPFVDSNGGSLQSIATFTY